MEEIAQVYARALFEVATEHDDIDLVREQLGQFADALDESRELQMFFFSPYFSTEEKEDGLPQWEALEADARFAHVLHGGTAHTGEGQPANIVVQPEDEEFLGIPGLLTPAQTAELLSRRDEELRVRISRSHSDSDDFLLVEELPDAETGGSWRDAAELRREARALLAHSVHPLVVDLTAVRLTGPAAAAVLRDLAYEAGVADVDLRVVRDPDAPEVARAVLDDEALFEIYPTLDAALQRPADTPPPRPGPHPGPPSPGG